MWGAGKERGPATQLTRREGVEEAEASGPSLQPIPQDPETTQPSDTGLEGPTPSRSRHCGPPEVPSHYVNMTESVPMRAKDGFE